MIDENLSIWAEYKEFKGLKVYPFVMNDYKKFEKCISVLLYEKNRIPDIRIVKMSYLKFIACVLPNRINDNNEYIYKDIFDNLLELLKYIFRNNNIKIKISDDDKLFIRIPLSNEKVVFISEQEFTELKSLILEQNAIYVFDDKLHPDLRKAIEESIAFQAKKNGHKAENIEDQIVAYKCEMKLDSYEPIRRMTIYQFRKELQRLNIIIDFKICKQAELSGMVTFKKPIPNWNSHISDYPDYSDFIMDRHEFEANMNSNL